MQIQYRLFLLEQYDPVLFLPIYVLILRLKFSMELTQSRLLINGRSISLSLSLSPFFSPSLGNYLRKVFDGKFP